MLTSSLAVASSPVSTAQTASAAPVQSTEPLSEFSVASGTHSAPQSEAPASSSLSLSPHWSNSTWEEAWHPDSVYDSPYHVALFSAENGEDKARLWSQTKSIFWYGVGVAGFIALLPEDISNWDTSDDRLFEKWWDNVRQGPVWDRDVWYINYIGHPYFGGVYYQIARKSGYRQWDAFVYSFLMSTFYWEYGVEAFAEVPAVQDLVVTPVLGWVYGEWAFNKEREIIQRGGQVWGSDWMGSTALFLLDPVDSLGRGVNHLFGRDVVKAGTGYLSLQDVEMANGKTDSRINMQVRFQFGEGDTTPAMQRRYTYTQPTTLASDPVDTGIVGFSVGTRYLNLDEKWGIENRWAATATLGLYFTPAFSTRLSYTRIDSDSKRTGERVTYENYSLDAQYYWLTDQAVRPYITAGIGETLLDLDRDTTTFQMNAGLGVHYQFHPKWAFVVDWVHYYSTRRETNDDLFAGQLIYRFGRGER
ncbi:DUF3943 domain-containing protein [Photobacterium aphoticum]|nr:DUF3943 domain-containing protein [Photobacterium aphoticum]